MSFSSPDLHSFWDISPQQPDTFSALPDDDFLAFLQKQFPAATGNNPPLSFDNPDGVDPQSISSFPPLNPSPPSSDSSPSPPSTHNESSLSRRQSGVFNDASSSSAADQQKGQAQQEDGSLKRKAATDNAEEPSHKSQHTSSSANAATKKGGGSNSRRKSGTPQDESRLLKRKEQNRAAQRAFRERKERHVKDLEDKVAALETKNHMTEQENENLKDLLQRLQNENMMLKQAAFTFTAPRSTPANGNDAAQNSFNSHNMQFHFASPGAGPSKSPTQSPPAQPSHHFDLNFNSLIPFDPNTLNPAEDFGGDMDMNVDSTFPYDNGTYKTIASNPMFTSFAEPSPSDSPPLLTNGGHQFTPGSFDSFSEHWTPPEASQDALEQLFGGGFLSPNANSVADFQAILASSPSSVSPVSHASMSMSMRTPSLSSASSSPPIATGTTSPQTANGSPALHNMQECPKTKEQLSKAIAEGGQSTFVQSPSNSASPASNADSASPASGAACEMPFAPFLKKSVDDNGTSPIVMCKGSSFPRTEKSDKNVEVLTAWRSITSNPQFKAQDVDINELCSEFTNKARCDGTKVVLEPDGVHHIIETLAARQAKGQK